MQFLSFANFYRKFIKYFNRIAILLTKILKSSQKFKSNKRKRQRNRNRNYNRDLLNNFFITKTLYIFKELKDIFTIISILRYFDSTLSLRVKIDIFDKAIETILYQ